MITIFSTPRPFTGEFDRIQRNAIRAWTLLERNCQIILVNDEENTTEATARELGVEFISKSARNEYGTPLLNDVFEQVRDRAQYDVMAHVNADILLFPEFVDIILCLERRLRDSGFLLLGRRWDLDVTGHLDTGKIGWREALLTRAKREGKLHGFAGMDYWVFPKSVNIRPPAFCVGRPGMDSWLVFQAKRLSIPVLDATEAITVVHQQHGYPQKRAAYFEIECERNVALAGGRANMLTLREADWLLTAGGELVRPPLRRILLSHLSEYAAWRKLLGAKRVIQRKIAGSSR